MTNSVANDEIASQTRIVRRVGLPVRQIELKKVIHL